MKAAKQNRSKRNRADRKNMIRENKKKAWIAAGVAVLLLAAGGVERIGLDKAFIKITLPNGEKKKIMHDMPDHKEGVNFVFQCLLDPEFGAIKSLSEIDAVGHRIVQGGDLFEKSVIVDKSVEDGIESLCDLAPVHNAGHLKGLRAVDKLMPEVPQVCVFDNAFHSTMPDYAYLYAVPYELYEKYHVRLYGKWFYTHDTMRRLFHHLATRSL